MIPKIEFRYSSIYDEKYKNNERIIESLKKENRQFPSEKEISDYIKKIEIIWKKEGSKVLKEISNEYGLKWTENKVICYIVGIGKPFSDPLTIMMYDDVKRFIYILSHELIHQITIQNKGNYNLKKWSEYIEKRYSKEKIITLRHILLHAVHYKIYLVLNKKEIFDKNINLDIERLDYKRSWQIVQEEGYKNIIKKFREVTK